MELLVGKRFFATDEQMSFTVVGVRPPDVLVQWYDGRQGVGVGAEELFNAVGVEVYGSHGRMDVPRYHPLPDGNTTLGDACPDGAHRFSPRPSALGLDDETRWREPGVYETYYDIARCRVCGLSATVLDLFLGHAIPIVCTRCEREAMPHEEAITFGPAPEWASRRLCESCTGAVTDSYEY
jgi:hypothetical protein